MNLTIPKAENGRVVVLFDFPPPEGIGIGYNRTWKTYYDRKKKYICIGDYSSSNLDGNVNIQFANHVIATIKDEQLIAVWAKVDMISGAYVMDNKDWRITNQDYLKGSKVILSKYIVSNNKWDHDHCEFCQTKFSEQENDLHVGYCTKDKKHWICSKCFDDFKNIYKLKLVDNGD